MKTHFGGLVEMGNHTFFMVACCTGKPRDMILKSTKFTLDETKVSCTNCLRSLKNDTYIRDEPKER